MNEARTSGGEPGPSLAVKNFLAAIESDDSLFCIAQPLAGPGETASAGGVVCSGDIVLEFRQAEYSRQKGLHFLLVEKLVELLKEAGSRDSLEAALSLTAASISVGGSDGEDQRKQKGLALWVRLSAKGDSPEQALLRWSLGLAHIQQALLFTSRHLRLHLAQTGT
ncbi:MAG: hypothetical protein WA857_06020 [Candidatus Acidiferrum sp.]